MPTPSPLSQEILSAKPYAFLDDAPLEERRTQAVASRRWLDPQTAAEFGKLDPNAIALVRDEAWPSVESVDELHDALMSLGVCTEAEAHKNGWGNYFAQLIQANRATRIVWSSDSRLGFSPTSSESRAEARPTKGDGTINGIGGALWVVTERLPMIRSIYADMTATPEPVVPIEYGSQTWDRSDAIVELMRGRLQATGPVTASSLSQLLMVEVGKIDAALLALEAQGFAMRGQFTTEATQLKQLEWCERRLLARIHRYTIQTLRAEIEPVSSADFMRFLLQWQGVIREPRPQGVEALSGIVEQLEGISIPAAAWESDVLPARLHEYDPNWLDSVCLSGRAIWLRMNPSKALAPVRTTPIVLLTRKHALQWQQWVGHDAEVDASLSPSLSHGAQALRDYLKEHGASFFADMMQGTHLLQSQAEEGLSELVAAGIVSADSFSGLRALVLPMDRKRKMAARAMRIAQFGLEDAGRWSLVKRPHADAKTSLDELAFILLKRYGVVFRKLLVHESERLPAWHLLLRVFRQLEAQGLIRGGRFVAGVTGEQYALPEAVTSLRSLRKQSHDGRLISLSAADPLNLSGILIPGPRIPALTGNRLLLRNGELVASYVGGETTLHTQFAPADEWAARNALLHKRVMIPIQPSALS